jgi:Rrf2 family protein
MKTLSLASVYAVKALARLVAEGGEPGVFVHQIAKAHRIPQDFLRKIFQSLVIARILRSQRGREGGYRLARPPEKISLLEVIETADAPIRGEAPQLGGNSKGSALDARLQTVCDAVAGLVRREFAAIRLSDLADPRTRTGRPIHSVATGAAARSSARSPAP